MHVSFPFVVQASQMEMTRLLKPLIDELKVLQDGVVMQDFDGRERVVIACLVLISADLPAIRKLMGVAAHNGTCSCLFCNVQFASLDNNQRDYSNTDIDSYPRRTKQTHAKNSADWMRAKTQGERDEHKKSTGTSSFSVFQELSYFDCVKFQTVDILHCSYLGICKRILRTIWLDINCTVEINTRLLFTKDLEDMAKLLKSDFVLFFRPAYSSTGNSTLISSELAQATKTSRKRFSIASFVVYTLENFSMRS